MAKLFADSGDPDQIMIWSELFSNYLFERGGDLQTKMGYLSKSFSIIIIRLSNYKYLPGLQICSLF